MIARFRLLRKKDDTGISGVGNVAEGARFSDGRVAIRWLSSYASTVIYDNMEDVVAVHGHHGNTEVVWDDVAVY